MPSPARTWRTSEFLGSTRYAEVPGDLPIRGGLPDPVGRAEKTLIVESSGASVQTKRTTLSV